MAKRIKEIGKKRKQLSEIFNMRAVAVKAINDDRDDLYRNAIKDLKDLVDKLEVT